MHKCWSFSLQFCTWPPLATETFQLFISRIVRATTEKQQFRRPTRNGICFTILLKLNFSGVGDVTIISAACVFYRPNSCRSVHASDRFHTWAAKCRHDERSRWQPIRKLCAWTKYRASRRYRHIQQLSTCEYTTLWINRTTCIFVYCSSTATTEQPKKINQWRTKTYKSAANWNTFWLNKNYRAVHLLCSVGDNRTFTFVFDENVSARIIASGLQDHANFDVVRLGHHHVSFATLSTTYSLAGCARHSVLDNRQNLCSTKTLEIVINNTRKTYPLAI